MQLNYRNHVLEIHYHSLYQYSIYQFTVDVDNAYTLNTLQFHMPYEVRRMPFDGVVMLDASDFPIIGIHWLRSTIQRNVDLRRLLQMIDEIDEHNRQSEVIKHEQP